MQAMSHAQDVSRKKTASTYAYGDRFRIVTRPREVYFPFGGTYNLFCFIGRNFL